MMKKHPVILIIFGILLLSGCSSPEDLTPTTTSVKSQHTDQNKQTPEQFVSEVNRQLEDLGKEIAAAQWVRVTYLTPDTALLAAKAQERWLEFHSKSVKKSRQFDNTPMSKESARAMHLLKLGTAMPAPDDPQKRAELAQIATRMEGQYGEGKYCPDGPDSCRTLNEQERRPVAGRR